MYAYVVIIIAMYLFYFNIDVPDVVMNVTIMDITRENFTVQWEEVMDIFDIIYNVTVYNENGFIRMGSVTGLSYPVNGVAANTLYCVTVVAINTCCGAGPVSNVTKVTTNDKPPPSSTAGNVMYIRGCHEYNNYQTTVPYVYILLLYINTHTCTHARMHTHTHLHT